MGISRPQTQAGLDELVRGKSVVLEVSIPACSQCQALETLLDGLDGEFPDVTFAQVNASDFNFLCETRGITSVPTLLLLCDGVELTRFAGPVPQRVIRHGIRTYLSGGAE